jgi:DNA replication protein DnaC
MENINFETYLSEILEKVKIEPNSAILHNCQICKDIGFVYNETGADLCKCQIKDPKKHPLCYVYDIDPILFENVKQTVNGELKFKPNQITALRKATNFFNNTTKKAPYLAGETTGIGKTLIISYLGFRKAQEQNLRTQFLPITDFKEKLIGCIHQDKPIDSVLNSLKYSLDFLILDDVGAEKVTEFHEENLYNLLNYRYSAQKPTAFTSNLKIDDLPYSARIKSRIHGLATEIHLSGMDYRRV